MAEGIFAITVPKWGLSMEKGTVIEWIVEVGDTISVGDHVADLETDKIAGEVEAQVSGILRRQVGLPGQELPVGALLGVVSEGAADDAVGDGAIDAFIADFQANFVPEESAGDGGDSYHHDIDVAGRRTAYLEASCEDAEGRLPLVLIHGFGGDSNGWLFNIAELGLQRPVYALDLPGHGRSSKDVGDGSLDTLVAALIGFMDALDLEKAHLAGHSMGGTIALAAAVDHGERVASVALLGGCGVGDTINGAFIEGFVTGARRKDMKPVLETLFPDPSLVTRDMVDDVLKYKRLDGVSEALRAIADSVFPGGKQAAQFRGRLADLGKPMLCIWGAEDRVVDPGDGQGLPDTVDVHILDGVGHMPHMEAAAKVNELLNRHLAAAEATT